MGNCRFCNIVKGCGEYLNPENKKILESDEYFAISSIGALVEGWTLIVPKTHCCSMKDIYSSVGFYSFANQVIEGVKACYGPIIAFEHGPNHEGSDTSCGTDHAHLHIVPYRSIAPELDQMDLHWEICRASEVSEKVGNSEYLLYCETQDQWVDPLVKIHRLKKPISQFFRRIIANDQGDFEKFNYKRYPDIELTTKTAERLSKFFDERVRGNDG